MKRIIRVNRNNILARINEEKDLPVIVVEYDNKVYYGMRAVFSKGEVVYGGGKVWLQSEEPVVLDGVEI